MSLAALQSQFPNSLRVERLEGLCLEAEGNLDIALDTYKNILEKNENDAFVLKRRVALYKQQGKIKNAIEALNLYLKNYSSDTDAYLELMELYLDQHEYKKAAFCAEELILSNPHHYLFHLKYAEVISLIWKYLNIIRFFIQWEIINLQENIIQNH